MGSVVSAVGGGYNFFFTPKMLAVSAILLSTSTIAKRYAYKELPADSSPIWRWSVEIASLAMAPFSIPKDKEISWGNSFLLSAALLLVGRAIVHYRKPREYSLDAMPPRIWNAIFPATKKGNLVLYYMVVTDQGFSLIFKEPPSQDVRRFEFTHRIDPIEGVAHPLVVEAGYKKVSSDIYHLMMQRMKILPGSPSSLAIQGRWVTKGPRCLNLRFGSRIKRLLSSKEIAAEERYSQFDLQIVNGSRKEVAHRVELEGSSFEFFDQTIEIWTHKPGIEKEGDSPSFFKDIIELGVVKTFLTTVKKEAAATVGRRETQIVDHPLSLKLRFPSSLLQTVQIKSKQPLQKKMVRHLLRENLLDTVSLLKRNKSLFLYLDKSEEITKFGKLIDSGESLLTEKTGGIEEHSLSFESKRREVGEEANTIRAMKLSRLLERFTSYEARLRQRGMSPFIDKDIEWYDQVQSLLSSLLEKSGGTTRDLEELLDELAQQRQILRGEQDVYVSKVFQIVGRCVIPREVISDPLEPPMAAASGGPSISLPASSPLPAAWEGDF